MRLHAYRSAYYRQLQRRARLPAGFLASTIPLTFKPREKPTPARMDLSLILLSEATPLFGAVYTSNRFPGAPVLIGRQRLNQKLMRGVLVNNKIANVGAPGAVEDALTLLGRLGEALSIPGDQLLPASTGIIGWRLPLQSMVRVLPGLAAGLQGDSILPVAEAIMTTDSYPKIRSVFLEQGSIVGIAKGAGMIEPRMATLLVFLLTDLALERKQLRRALKKSVESSFNCISVDGDQSTSDMAVLLSSGKWPGVSYGEFQKALTSVCRALAEDVVRNGEGVGHVIKVRVKGAKTRQLAREAGKAIINSPLIKTAIYGNDPNVGRFLAALGDYLSSSDAELPEAILQGTSISLGRIEVFKRGVFCLDGAKENRLNHYLQNCSLDPALKGFPQHERSVEMVVNLNCGREAVDVMGADLTAEYVRENAEYRS